MSDGDREAVTASGGYYTQGGALDADFDARRVFADIVGYDDIKHAFQMAIRADRPVHVLLTGPPGTAKSLFMAALEKHFAQNARVLDATSTKKAGVVRYIIDTPGVRVLLIDEFEKMDGQKDFYPLLSLMADGRVAEMKAGRTDYFVGLKIRVFAFGNSEANIPAPVLDRFSFKPKLPKYTDEEFTQVLERILPREGASASVARVIAKELIARGKVSVREAVGIARVARSAEDVRSVMELQDKYSGKQLVSYVCSSPGCKRRGHIVTVEESQNGG